MEKWVVQAKKANFQEIATKFQIDPVTARIIRNRDIIGDENMQTYLKGTLDECYSPWLLKDMERGIEILEDSIKKGEKIRIIGDYDIDGVMSTYILYQGLSRIYEKVEYQIPHRIHDGYGINIDIIEKAFADNVALLITCDNGISATQQVQKAKELGMRVIITDHHEVPYEKVGDDIRYILPKADAIINPKQVDCAYPFKEICGALVAYKFICAVYETLDMAKESEDFLEYAAFATIGDVMDLVEENRIIVKEGMKRIRCTKNYGLAALIRENNLQQEQIEPYHIGFVLGPCMNASGRLETAMISLELLESKDSMEATLKAKELKKLNDSRKELTLIGMEAAFSQIESTSLIHDKVLVVYLENCHESLAGIIAGRIRERYHKPAFVLTDKSDEGDALELKGSGRSMESYSMYEEMSKCKDLFIKFGGHPMAAGFSIKKENLEVLRTALNENTTLTDEDLIEKVTIDVPMPLSYVSEALIEEFEILQPFGKGNSKPIFAQKNIIVDQVRLLGANQNVAKMYLIDEQGQRFEGICFKEAKSFVSYIQEHPVISIVYYPNINEFNGKRSIQFVITHYK